MGPQCWKFVQALTVASPDSRYLAPKQRVANLNHSGAGMYVRVCMDEQKPCLDALVGGQLTMQVFCC